jgi:hypothetical protein
MVMLSTSLALTILLVFLHSESKSMAPRLTGDFNGDFNGFLGDGLVRFENNILGCIRLGGEAVWGKNLASPLALLSLHVGLKILLVKRASSLSNFSWISLGIE